MRNSSSGRSVAAPSSLSTAHWLASDIYKADVYDNAEDKIGVVTDLIIDNSGNVTTAVVGVGGGSRSMRPSTGTFRAVWTSKAVRRD
jgi:sporulation protein YlmC with PRC-barrel domain